MKIKNKQWYRTGRNVINQILGSSGEYTDDYGIIKVADTPQELIQEKDVVEINGGLFLVMYIENNEQIYIYDSSGEYVFVLKRDITKILTPNGKDYTCQWENTN